MLVSLIVAFVPSAGCASASAGLPTRLAFAPAESTAASDPFPTPSGGLKIQIAPGEEMSLERLLDEFSRVTGQNLLISEGTCQALKSASTGLNRSVEVPANEVYSFVENILVHNQCVLEVLSDREPRLLGVHNLALQNRNSNRPPSLPGHFVPAKDIGPWAGHRAVLVTTMIELPSTDVHTLSNSMRSLLHDVSTQQIVPVGTTHSLILSGSGTAVANLVSILRECDEAARKAEEAHQKEKEQERERQMRDESRRKQEEKREGAEAPPK